MARVILDVSAVGEKWFQNALADLIKSANVRFVYSDHDKYRKEVASNGFLGRFLQLMKQKQMRDDTDPQLCEVLITQLNELQAWSDEYACDDPHIFAMAYQKPGAFVFTSDKRIVKCRSCMNAHIDKKFRSFSTVQSEANYTTNAHKIKA